MKKMLCLTLLTISILTARTMWVRVYYNNDIERQLLIVRSYDILGGNAQRGYFEYFLDEESVNGLIENGFRVDILNSDIINYLEENYGGLRMTFGEYYTYDEMDAEITQIASQYPNITKKVNIGTTWQNRTVWAMKISDNPQQTENEHRVLIDGVHHAREPIGCSICIDFIKYLVQNYGVKDTVTTIVNNDEVWVVPVVNPDGYVFNETYNDPWGNGYRKNCRDNDSSGNFDPTLDGVDLNRNYGYQWGYDNNGSSPDPTNEAYRGPYAFSEPETQAMRIVSDSADFEYALSYHSYSGFLLYPWSYINALTPDSLLYKAMAETMTTIIGLPNNYPYGTPYQTIGYNANGCSFDWMYGEQTEKPKCVGFGAEIGASFWKGAADTNIIIQQCNETRPMNIYLCYKAALVGIEEKSEPAMITGFEIRPNPVRNGSISMSFNLKQQTRLSLTLYDALGRIVYYKPAESYSPGPNLINIVPPDLSSGIYFIDLGYDRQVIVKEKLIIIDH